MNLPEKVEVPRSLVPAREPIQVIALHAFGDGSAQGVAAAVYAVVEQETGVKQGVVAAKARLPKQELSIPRLELVAGHMAVNLLSNVHDALTGFPVHSLNAWLDSTVALHWIKGPGDYKQFVGNHVRKIKEKESVVWRHVPTHENPADLGSRGGPVNKEKSLWWEGPTWLKDPGSWPPDIVTSATPESDAEAKATKQIFALAVHEEDAFDDLLSRRTFWRTLRVGAWIVRFLHNTRAQGEGGERITGPLTTEEIEKQKIFWEKRAQRQCAGLNHFEEDMLKMNPDGLLECRGRIQGDYPVYLPDSAIYTEKLVQHAHEVTLHRESGFNYGQSASDTLGT